MAKIEKDLKEHKEKEELHHQMKKDKNKNSRTGMKKDFSIHNKKIFEGFILSSRFIDS